MLLLLWKIEILTHMKPGVEGWALLTLLTLAGFSKSFDLFPTKWSLPHSLFQFYWWELRNVSKLFTGIVVCRKVENRRIVMAFVKEEILKLFSFLFGLLRLTKVGREYFQSLPKLCL